MHRLLVALTSIGLLLAAAVASRAMAAQPGRGVVPSFSFIEASGCDGLFLYAWNEARSEVLTIRVDRSRVKLVDGTTTLNLATAGEAVAVQIELTGARRETMPYCSESGRPADDRPTVWNARSGTLKIVFRRRAAALITPMSVTLDDLVLMSPEGTETRAKRTIQFTAAIFELAP